MNGRCVDWSSDRSTDLSLQVKVDHLSLWIDVGINPEQCIAERSTESLPPLPKFDPSSIRDEGCQKQFQQRLGHEKNILAFSLDLRKRQALQS